MRFFAETFIFIVMTPNTHKTMPRVQYSTCVITFHPPQNAPNGAFTRQETTAGARLDCDARNCFDARTISDARGSNDARTEWIANLSTISPPRSYLAPVLAWGPTQVPIIGREGTLVWTLPKRTSPQPTRGDVELKVNFRQFVWYVPLWPVDTNEQYRVVASLNGLKFNPLIFFSSGPCFTDIWKWSVDWHCHLAINSHTCLSVRNGPGGGSNLGNFYVAMSW